MMCHSWGSSISDLIAYLSFKFSDFGFYWELHEAKWTKWHHRVCMYGNVEVYWLLLFCLLNSQATFGSQISSCFDSAFSWLHSISEVFTLTYKWLFRHIVFFLLSNTFSVPWQCWMCLYKMKNLGKYDIYFSWFHFHRFLITQMSASGAKAFYY